MFRLPKNLFKKCFCWVGYGLDLKVVIAVMLVAFLMAASGCAMYPVESDYTGYSRYGYDDRPIPISKSGPAWSLEDAADKHNRTRDAAIARESSKPRNAKWSEERSGSRDVYLRTEAGRYGSEEGHIVDRAYGEWVIPNR